MSGCGFFEVGMDGLVETGLGKWKLNSANSAFFFRLYGEPFGASVFSSPFKNEQEPLAKQDRTNGKTAGPIPKKT
jgi:hypothetical protein